MAEQRLLGAKVWKEVCKNAPSMSGHQGSAAHRSHLSREGPLLGIGTSFLGGRGSSSIVSFLAEVMTSAAIF